MKYFLLLLCYSLAACNLSKTPEKAQIPLEQKVTWAGQFARVYTKLAPENADTTNPARPVQSHSFLFSGADSLRLRLTEFTTGYWAYAEFLKQANLKEIADGFYQSDDSAYFYHGNFFGVVGPVEPGVLVADSFKASLSFQGEDLFAKPKEFGTFPLLGRIPNSERIIVDHFLGREWQGPVFTVSYRCHEDTAVAFRALPQDINKLQLWVKEWTGKEETINTGKEMRFHGWDEFRQPLEFEVFSGGVMGLTRCFDTQLGQEYVEKMKKTAVLWEKP